MLDMYVNVVYFERDGAMRVCHGRDGLKVLRIHI